jgi:ADP-ribose pyrophosphatase YjhB (NUDIX family)
MAELGATVAIIDNGRIFLTKREDFEVWCLPGGAVDEGESPAQAAVREAFEETGLRVELTRLVGIYSRPRWWSRMHLTVFAARPVGGSLRLDPHEVVEAGYFGLDELPEPLLIGHHRQILDALSGVAGAVYSFDQEWPYQRDMTRAELYAWRDRSGLSRQQFYLKYLQPPGSQENTLEVAGAISHS